MTKLSDIARVVNLNVSVVSRALSPSSKKNSLVSPATRKRILAAAEKLEYIPDRTASFLRRRGAPTILCYLPNISDRLLCDLSAGISEQALKENFPVNFFFGKDNSDFENFCRHLGKIKHSGIITYPPPKMSEPMWNELKKYHSSGGSVLILNDLSNGNLARSDFPAIPRLEIDDYYGGKLVAEHMLSRGAERFFHTASGLIGPDFRNSGFCETLERVGKHSELFEPEQISGLKKSSGKVGIFCAADFFAIDVMLLLASAKVRIGKEFLIAGYDDQFMSMRVTPSLTTVHQPTREEGRLAVKKLIHMIDGANESAELLKPYLMVRESTGGHRPDPERSEFEEVIR